VILNTILAGLRPMDTEATAALDVVRGQPVALAGSVDDDRWELVERDAERVVLLGVPVAPGSDPAWFASAVVYRDADGWRTLAPGLGAISQCQMWVSANGHGPAELRLDPASTGIGDGRRLRLQARERACASGRPPEGRAVCRPSRRPTTPSPCWCWSRRRRASPPVR
jgi:hypothetical protein